MVRRNLFYESEELPPPSMAECGSEVVELLDDESNVVGKGVVFNNFTCGMELHDVKLCPSKIGVRITHVLDGSKWVGELVGEFLCDCVGEIVWWPGIQVRCTQPV